jgi:hypothetical protein
MQRKVIISCAVAGSADTPGRNPVVAVKFLTSGNGIRVTLVGRKTVRCLGVSILLLDVDVFMRRVGNILDCWLETMN